MFSTLQFFFEYCLNSETMCGHRKSPLPGLFIFNNPPPPLKKITINLE